MPLQFINYNGDLYPESQPVLTGSNRAFRYGDGLFETMRVIKGELKFADFHAERLQGGMQALKIDGYAELDAYFLKEKSIELMRRNQIGGNARVRLTIFRDGDGLYTPMSNKFGYALEASALDNPYYQNNDRGLIVDIFDEVTKPINILSSQKTCNSLIYVLAGIFKTQNGLDEAFILNQNGFLCEATSANVFVVYEKQLYTPALSEGCVAGVMRRVVMNLAEENNIPLIEAQINPAIMNEAEEVFVTNATSGIQWVMGYDKKRYFNEISRFLIEKLNFLIK